MATFEHQSGHNHFVDIISFDFSHIESLETIHNMAKQTRHLFQSLAKLELLIVNKANWGWLTSLELNKTRV